MSRVREREATGMPQHMRVGLDLEPCRRRYPFQHAGKAEKLRDQLEDEYANSNVIDFQGPTGYWVRIRPQGDNREQAERIAQRLRPAEGDAYLVRLD